MGSAHGEGFGDRSVRWVKQPVRFVSAGCRSVRSFQLELTQNARSGCILRCKPRQSWLQGRGKIATRLPRGYMCYVEGDHR